MSPVGGVPVVVLGADAGVVADRVATWRAEGRRAAGFVGSADEPANRAAAEAMGTELFGSDGGSYAIEAYPGTRWCGVSR